MTFEIDIYMGRFRRRKQTNYSVEVGRTGLEQKLLRMPDDLMHQKESPSGSPFCSETAVQYCFREYRSGQIPSETPGSHWLKGWAAPLMSFKADL